MTFEEYLKSLGLDDEQVTSITAGMEENKFYLTSEQNLEERYNKAAQQRDEAKEQLDESNERITELEAAAEEVQKTLESNQSELEKLEELQGQVETLTSENSSIKRTTKLEKLLTKAGVNDIDYILNYKMRGGEDLEVGEDGEFTNFDDKLNELKESYPKYFEAPEPPKDDKGWTPLDNNPKDGKNVDFDPFSEKIAKYNQ